MGCRQSRAADSENVDDTVSGPVAQTADNLNSSGPIEQVKTPEGANEVVAEATKVVVDKNKAVEESKQAEKEDEVQAGGNQVAAAKVCETPAAVSTVPPVLIPSPAGEDLPAAGPAPRQASAVIIQPAVARVITNGSVTEAATQGESFTRWNSRGRPMRSALKSDDASPTSRRTTGDSTEIIKVKFKDESMAPAETKDEVAARRLSLSREISMKKIVDHFYDRVLGDKELLEFFSGIDMIKLKRHQVRFMQLAFGGKALVYEEDPTLDLRKIHWRLIRDRGLTERHWEQFMKHFEQTLESMPEIPKETRELALTSLAGTRQYFRPIEPEEMIVLGVKHDGGTSP